MNAKKCKRQMKDSRRDQTQLTLFIYSFFNERFLFMNINISLVLAFKKKVKNLNTQFLP